MIVVCTSCQARFRVADEKVGPRGVRVRCSKCKAVFPVGPLEPGPADPGAPAPPAAPVRSAPPPIRTAPPPIRRPPPSAPAPVEARPVPTPTPFAVRPSQDPFANLALSEPTPDGRPVSRAAADPFAAYAEEGGPGASIPEPTPLAGPALESAGPPGVPRNGSGEPQAGFLGSLPVTNLADLERTGTRHVAARPGAPPPLAADPDLGLALEERTPVGIPIDDIAGANPPDGEAGIPDPEPFPGLDSASPAEAVAAVQGGGWPEPERAAASPGEGAEGTEAVAAPGHPYGDDFAEDLAAGQDFGPALETGRVRIPPAPVEPPPFDPTPVLQAEWSGGSEQGAEGRFQRGSTAPSAAPGSPGAGARAPRGAGLSSRPKAAASSSLRGEEPGPVESDVLGPGRLHAVLVNAVSLGLLLFLTLGILLVWRGDGPLAYLRRAQGGASAALEVGRTSNGYYDTAAGRPLVFLRGEVLGAGATPAGSVRVRAEMIRSGRVLASADGIAGSLPTPEELASLVSRDDEERLRTALAARAAAQPVPGVALPFLVAFVDPPAELGDVTFRVVAEAAPRP